MADTTPASSLLEQLSAELMAHAPFAQMQPEHVRQFVTAAREAYYAPGEVVLEPAMGPVRTLLLLRQGRITARRGAGAGRQSAVRSRATCSRSVHCSRRARCARPTPHSDDCFCLLLPADAVQALARASTPFADFLERRALHFFELAQQALRETYASEALHEQSLEAPLSTLRRKPLLACAADTALAQALALMHERRVGSVVVVDAQRAPQGILTRHDILGRVTLPALPLATPIGAVMSAPVHVLEATRHAAGRGAADVAPWHAPRAGVRARRAGRHRVGARPVRAAAPVAQGPVDAHPRGAPTCRRCSARRTTSGASRATCSARACRRASSPN